MAILQSVLAATLFLADIAQGALKYRGADWSSVAVLEQDAIVQYKNFDGEVMPLESILAENGINLVRQRVVCPLFSFLLSIGSSPLQQAAPVLVIVR